MSANDAQSISSLTSAGPGRDVATTKQSKPSLSQRVTSRLFGAKAAHVNRFALELDDEHRTYGPGETVSGTVILDVARPLGVTHVLVSLYGNVQVFRSHAAPKVLPNENGRSVTRRGKRWVSEYYGDGFVSLFEEEVILCGEGCLEPKLYHFRFEIEFPSHLNLPSSIEFERGMVSYKVTATVTRPATMVATLNANRKVTYKEDINIASLPPPKPREASLRPISRGRPLNNSLQRHMSNDSNTPSSTTKGASRLSTLGRSLHSDRTTRDSSISVKPSEQPRSIATSSRSSITSHTISLAATTSPTLKTKTADLSSSPNDTYVRVELEKAGCLAGQLVYVRIRVDNHYKLLRKPKGILVTVYRQARVDMHPNLPLSGSAGAGAKYEDYYPRSRTGLGGLSLSSAGSDGVWRKDLSQTAAPLYIDPTTMSAELRVGVKIPDEAFPSISSVPGGMISFKYYVEVIIDIQGKLYLDDVPSIGISTVTQAIDGRPANAAEGQIQTMVLGTDCFDTTSLRRDKHAVVLQCDLIVGTKDYTSQKGKAPLLNETSQTQSSSRGPNQPELVRAQEGAPWPEADEAAWYYEPQYDWTREDYGDGHGFEEGDHDAHYDYAADYQYGGAYQGHHYAYDQHARSGGLEEGQGYRPETARSLFPLPPAVHQSGASEKERLRRQEASLLPSRPPADDEDEGTYTGASAPVLPSAPTLSADDGCFGVGSLVSTRRDQTSARARASLGTSQLQQVTDATAINGNGDEAGEVVEGYPASAVIDQRNPSPTAPGFDTIEPAITRPDTTLNDEQIVSALASGRTNTTLHATITDLNGVDARHETTEALPRYER